MNGAHIGGGLGGVGLGMQQNQSMGNLRYNPPNIQGNQANINQFNMMGGPGQGPIGPG